MGINIRESKNVQEMGVCELVYNDCYAKDKQAFYRNYDIDISARDLIRDIFKSKNIAMPYEFWNDNDYFDMTMYDNLQYGFENDLGILAILYQQIWSKADMREVIIAASKGANISTMI